MATLRLQASLDEQAPLGLQPRRKEVTIQGEELTIESKEVVIEREERRVKERMLQSNRQMEMAPKFRGIVPLPPTLPDRIKLLSGDGRATEFSQKDFAPHFVTTESTTAEQTTTHEGSKIVLTVSFAPHLARAAYWGVDGDYEAARRRTTPRGEYLMRRTFSGTRLNLN
ncbi:hypothetical protein WN55_06570 [Dufourea novaeangliae]|uniref:Uncharacterized protein n=1 Tax=Dufourea novaeangliae TaxID=178035 RepID=A0A154PQA8_DUFNO|nr:hypothetical protein WN55_06570 [Dufourea novaeangliae]